MGIVKAVNISDKSRLTEIVWKYDLNLAYNSLECDLFC